MTCRCSVVILIIGSAIIAIGLFLGLYLFPRLINDSIDESVKIVNNTVAFKQWEELPVPLKFKVYVFNVTNSEDVKQGAKPVLKEMGPYVYDEYRKKLNISDEGEGILSYEERQFYQFNAEDSGSHNETDEITIVNLPLMAIVTTVAEESPRNLNYTNTHLPKMLTDRGIFLRTTVRDFLFDGIFFECSNFLICSQIRKKRLQYIEEVNFGNSSKFMKFSLMSSRNSSTKGRFKVNDGTLNLETLGSIVSWKNGKLDVWNPQVPLSECEKTASVGCKQSKNFYSCNDIQGTDSTIFPPHRTVSTPLISFDSDICRSAELLYDTEVKLKNDIDAFRYKIDANFLKSNASFPANGCFCLRNTTGLSNTKECLLDGALELSRCQNSPLVFTYPHFYQADPLYQNGVEGLSPEESRHTIFVDIEPNTGVILRGKKRGQFNIFYRKIKEIDMTANLRNTLMPIFWIDEGIDQPLYVLDELEKRYFKPKRLLNYGFYGLTAFGALLVIISIIMMIV